MYAVPPGSTRSSAVGTCVCVPTMAVTRPSKYQPNAIFSDVASACISTKMILALISLKSRSATRKGSSLDVMNTRPCRLNHCIGDVFLSSLIDSPARQVRGVVCRAKDSASHAVLIAIGHLEIIDDFAFVPNVIAGGDYVDAYLE